jgi:low temperature requirement protein LtrA
VVLELGNHPWSWIAALTACLGLILAFSFWWIYFDNLDDAVIRAARERGRIWIYQSWLYAHFPLYAALAATGVGIAYAIRADQ